MIEDSHFTTENWQLVDTLSWPKASASPPSPHPSSTVPGIPCWRPIALENLSPPLSQAAQMLESRTLTVTDHTLGKKCLSGWHLWWGYSRISVYQLGKLPDKNRISLVLQIESITTSHYTVVCQLHLSTNWPSEQGFFIMRTSSRKTKRTWEAGGLKRMIKDQ